MTARRPALAQAFAAAIFAEVDRVLRERGIRALPVKGVVTGALLYGRAGEREIRDVDVRIKPQDLAATLRIARERGWPLRDVNTTYGSFIAVVGGLDVDIETSCGPPGFSGLEIASMLARSEPGPSAELSRIPELHDHVLLLVVNAVKDHLVDAMPPSVEDLRRIVRLPRFSVDRLCELARETHTLFMVHLVARYLRREVATWAECDVRLSSGHPVRSRAVERFIALAQGAAHGTLALRVATRLTPDGWGRPVGALIRGGIFELHKARRR